MPTDQTENIARLFQALNAYDADALGSLLTEDATLKSAGGPTYHGAEAPARLMTDLSRVNTSWDASPTRCLGFGDVAVVEWTALLTDFGGGQNRLDGCAVLDFSGDRIRSARLYWRPEDMRD